jgi:predicted nucleic acid-binding protein
MVKLYLDSSVIVKRYIAEKGSQSVAEIYQKSDTKEIGICFSMWNIGETIGVIDQYQRKGWITEGQFISAIGGLAGETLRLMRIEALELLPVSSSELSETWDLIRRYHIYQGDAVQVVACARSKADRLISADKMLLEVAEKEGITSVNVEDARAMGEL